MAYITPGETYWVVSGLADGQAYSLTFTLFNESETSSDDFADAIRNAVDAMTDVSVAEARKYGTTSSSF